MKQGKVKQDLVDRLHVRLGITKTLAAEMVDTLVDEVIAYVAEGHSVTLSGFGVFEQRHRRDRVGTNPQTREKMVIPGGVFPSFRPGKRFCREVRNKPVFFAGQIRETGEFKVSDHVAKFCPTQNSPANK